QDPLAKASGLSYLQSCKAEQQKINKLKRDLEQAARDKERGRLQAIERDLKDSMGRLGGYMARLFDFLPENQIADFPVKPGQFVTVPYKGTERKGEILFVSGPRVYYKVDAISGKLDMPTSEFRDKWKSGEIREYVEGSLREKYLGGTPGKASNTGKDVIKRYNVRTVGTVVEVEWKPGMWHPLADCDMSHEPIDAVDYWNSTGRHTGPKSDEVRKWMLDPANYILEPSAINRSRGSRTKSNYLPPTA
ncbi:MAG: hypothetical protein JOY92_12600, partial [Verrucomicrobia bacterium]|nr:hypothetical protein [Verrucomicrobiota bacterium]